MPRVKRRDVEQQHVLHVALQHAGLHGGAERHHFVRVHTLVGLAAEEGSCTAATTLGIRVMPPTRTTSSMSDFL